MKLLTKGVNAGLRRLLLHRRCAKRRLLRLHALRLQTLRRLKLTREIRLCSAKRLTIACLIERAQSLTHRQVLLTAQQLTLQARTVAAKRAGLNCFSLLLRELLTLLLLHGLTNRIDDLLHVGIHVSAGGLPGICHAGLRRHCGSHLGVRLCAGGNATKTANSLLLTGSELCDKIRSLRAKLLIRPTDGLLSELHSLTIPTHRLGRRLNRLLLRRGETAPTECAHAAAALRSLTAHATSPSLFGSYGNLIRPTSRARLV